MVLVLYLAVGVIAFLDSIVVAVILGSVAMIEAMVPNCGGTNNTLKYCYDLHGFRSSGSASKSIRQHIMSTLW